MGGPLGPVAAGPLGPPPDALASKSQAVDEQKSAGKEITVAVRSKFPETWIWSDLASR